MSKKEKQTQPSPEEERKDLTEQDSQQPESEAPQPDAAATLQAQLEVMCNQVKLQEDKYLRLAAEYDNYRKRTAKEKEGAWMEAKAETALAFLPVYDNLERALKQETADEAYKKGVEMTMTQLKEVLAKLGISEIPALGEVFDPNRHNAVMHIEDEELGESVVAEVFQAGFQCGEKVIRFAMVKVAN